MSRRVDPSRTTGGTRLVVPWLAYLAVTIVAPAVNGAWRRPDFASHAVLTSAVSGALLMAWWLMRKLLNRNAARG